MTWFSPFTFFAKSFTLDFRRSSECASINGSYLLKVTDNNNRLMFLTYVNAPFLNLLKTSKSFWCF